MPREQELHTDACVAVEGAPAVESAPVPSPMVQRKIAQRAVQRMKTVGGAEADAATVQAAADRGTQGGGSSLPHADAIQRSFGPGHDVSAVRAHVGGAAADAARAMGAEGYATGDHVAFAQAPDLRLAAHEAAHVVQQREGVHLSTGVGQVGDAWEQHADAVADRVVAGRSATDLLDGLKGSGGGAAVQRFVDVSKQDQKADEWNGNGKDVRVSDDGMMAVAQESYAGGKKFYAEASLIPKFASVLKAKSSAITLTDGHATITGHKPGTQSKVTLTQVMPVNTHNVTGGDDMELPADCGKAAGKVMGVGNGGNTDTREAHFKDSKGKAATAQGEPDEMKFKILVDHLPDAKDKDGKPALSPTDMVKLNRLRQQLALTLDKWRAEGDHAKKEALEKEYDRTKAQIDRLLADVLARMSAQGREELAKKAGINEFAAPGIGDAYVVSSGGPPKKDDKGKNVMTWNFHWGGVVGQSGGDNVTLENYATGVPNEENKEWVFQMYGAPHAGHKPKDGQSFHEQTRDIHRQHGEQPTTMSVAPKPK